MPVVRADQVVTRLILLLTLSDDHRLVDGAAAQGFPNTARHVLEDPAR